MTFANLTNVNFEFGEISPLARGRYDLKIGQNGLERCQNFLVQPYGPTTYRQGFKYVHHTRLNQVAVFIEFQFNDSQSYLIEATDLKFRFYKDEAIILETAKNITAASKANPGVITSNAHGFSNGDEVYITGVGGMTELNGKYYLVAGVTANTFTLTDIWGTAINTTAFTTYTSGGTVARVYEITTPYVLADLAELKYAQNADTMYIVHTGYEPRKLTRSGHASWTLATYVRTADPFTGAGDWPGAVCFTSDGRLLMARTTNKPETLWGSRMPDTGTPRYDDFTTGTDATHAVIFTLAPLHGKVDSIQWLTNTSKFIVAGTFGSVRRIFGSNEDATITPTAITSKSVDTFGCASAIPVTNGTTVFYIERGNERVRSFEYDFQIDGYVSIDRNIVSSHLTVSGVDQMVFQAGVPNVIWVVRTDGVLLGFTFEEHENKSGWHRHYVGGTSAKVLYAGIMPRPSAQEQLWIITERTINGHTVRSVEFMTDAVEFPELEDFFTDEDSEDDDKERWLNALYESQKEPVFVDMALSFDGSDTGIAAGASITPSAVTGSSITLTASAAVFTSAMVGRQIWKKYNSAGNGGGRALITAFTDSTHVTAQVLDDFDATTAIAAGNWYLTAASVTGLHHLEGQTVKIQVDGASHPEAVVTAGAITLNDDTSVVHVGLGYKGLIKTMNLEMAGMAGSAQSKPRNVAMVLARFLNTNACKMGTNLYTLEECIFRTTEDIVSRPIPLFTGFFEQKIEDNWERQKKNLYILHDEPLPLTLEGLDIYGETTNE